MNMQTDWLLVIIASLGGSLFSLIGGLLLLSKKLSVSRVQRVAIPFAAGALLAAASVWAVTLGPMAARMVTMDAQWLRENARNAILPSQW